MEVKSVRLVRFSRPLLIRVQSYKDDYIYQTIYGFQIVLPEHIKLDPIKVNHYVGYLCALHNWSSGYGDVFTVNKSFNLVDKKGQLHIKMDKWLEKNGEKCRKRLNLTYDIITVDIDEEYLNHCLNEEYMIVDEELYYDLERFIEV